MKFRITNIVLFVVCLVIFSSASGGQNSTIGAPRDGDHYAVTSSTEVRRADAAHCGYNDLGAANIGIYRKEERSHEEYKDGRLVRRWNDTVEEFLHCYEP